MNAPSLRGVRQLLAVGAGACLGLLTYAGCTRTVLIGSDAPSTPDAQVEASLDASFDASLDANPADAAMVDADSGFPAIPFPFHTGFENGFAEYSSYPYAFCYYTGGGFYSLVTSPVHTGMNSLAFSVSTVDGGQSQARCELQGVLPPAGYYGAWYYIPALVTNRSNWNLIHFQGATDPDAAVSNLWDVSLVNDASGALHLTLLNSQTKMIYGLGTAPAIPIASWFHVEIYLRVAADMTGEVRLIQDGVTIVDVTNVQTDTLPWGEFHVGNLADNLAPPNETLFVDDITIDPDE